LCLHEWVQAYAKLLAFAMQGIHAQRWRIEHTAAGSPPEVVVFCYAGQADTAVKTTEKGRIKTERNKRVKYRNKK